MTPKRPRRRLSRRAEQAIAALLEHGTQEKAAAALGISPVTLWRLQRKPEFRKALSEARSDAFAQAIGRLAFKIILQQSGARLLQQLHAAGPGQGLDGQ